jgi:predicted MFS family arabinose efflux permease
MHTRLDRNPHLLVCTSAFRAALFPIPVITLFWKDHIGMSLAEIMWLQAIFGAVVVVFEFPTGYVADRVGYRLSLLIGTVFWLLGWIAYALGTTFAAMIVAEVVLGIGFAFTSGADSALLFISLKPERDPTEYRQWEGRVRAAAQTSEAISSGLGGWLYSLTPRLPFWFQVPVALANVTTVTAMLEVRPTGGGDRVAHLRRALRIVQHALLQHPRLRSAMALSVALGVSTYVAVWLIQPWMQLRGIPTAWFGVLWAAAHLWLAAISLASARVAEFFGVAKTLFACSLLAAASFFGLSFSESPLAVIFYLGFMTVRGLQGPLLVAALQSDAPPEDRASVLSLNALLFRLVAALVLPPIGAMGDHLGIDGVLAWVGIFSLSAALAAWFAFARAHAGSG